MGFGNETIKGRGHDVIRSPFILISWYGMKTAVLRHVNRANAAGV